MNSCPCGSQQHYIVCCGTYISDGNTPSTPEALMRSRYTAYTRADMDYIAKTMKGPAAKNFDWQDARAWAKAVEWLGLEVVSTRIEGTKGFVEFIARFKQNNQLQLLHELSEFRFENNQWFYVDGVML